MDRLMKKLGLLALCTGLSLAVHAVTPQAEAPAEQNVKIDSVVVTGARYASSRCRGCSPLHAGSWATACRTAPREASPCAG